jgi:hypothetical protein
MEKEFEKLKKTKRMTLFSCKQNEIKSTQVKLEVKRKFSL